MPPKKSRFTLRCLTLLRRDCIEPEPPRSSTWEAHADEAVDIPVNFIRTHSS